METHFLGPGEKSEDIRVQALAGQMREAGGDCGAARGVVEGLGVDQSPAQAEGGELGVAEIARLGAGGDAKLQPGGFRRL